MERIGLDLKELEFTEESELELYDNSISFGFALEVRRICEAHYVTEFHVGVTTMYIYLSSRAFSRSIHHLPTTTAVYLVQEQHSPIGSIRPTASGPNKHTIDASFLLLNDERALIRWPRQNAAIAD